MKQKITLTIEDTLIEKMKIHALKAKTSASAITEELWREFLKRPKPEPKPKQ
jgi:hypothetical protein